MINQATAILKSGGCLIDQAPARSKSGGGLIDKAASRSESGGCQIKIRRCLINQAGASMKSSRCVNKIRQLPDWSGPWFVKSLNFTRTSLSLGTKAIYADSSSSQLRKTPPLTCHCHFPTGRTDIWWIHIFRMFQVMTKTVSLYVSSCGFLVYQGQIFFLSDNYHYIINTPKHDYRKPLTAYFTFIMASETRTKTNPWTYFYLLACSPLNIDLVHMAW